MMSLDAREGFPVTQTIAHYWRISVPRLSKFPGFAEQFTIDGRAPKEGELFANPNLARTLGRIAEGGRAAFYEGEIADFATIHFVDENNLSLIHI